jgi:16S rRNA processing protein RimM
MPNSDLVLIGRIGAPYGIKGWVKINSYTRPASNISTYPKWFLKKPQGDWQLVAVEACKPHGKTWIVKLGDIADPEQAKSITHAEVAVERDSLPPAAADEIYWMDLEGCTVINLAGITLGKVDYMLETAGSDVMMVKGEHDYLIPFLRDRYIKAVDIEDKQITVDWDENFF